MSDKDPGFHIYVNQFDRPEFPAFFGKYRFMLLFDKQTPHYFVMTEDQLQKVKEAIVNALGSKNEA